MKEKSTIEWTDDIMGEQSSKEETDCRSGGYKCRIKIRCRGIGIGRRNEM
jgi:hypothetical protein